MLKFSKFISNIFLSFKKYIIFFLGKIISIVLKFLTLCQISL